eukprot:3055678-Rhodomonas_salina.3
MSVPCHDPQLLDTCLISVYCVSICTLSQSTMIPIACPRSLDPPYATSVPRYDPQMHMSVPQPYYQLSLYVRSYCVHSPTRF